MKKRARNILTVSFALLLSLVMGISIMTGARETKADYTNDISYYSGMTICVPVASASELLFAKTSGSVGYNIATVYTYQKESLTEISTYTAYARYNFSSWNYYNGIGYYNDKLQINTSSSATNLTAVDLTDLDYIVIAFADTSDIGTDYITSNPDDLEDAGVTFMNYAPDESGYDEELSRIFNYDIYLEGYTAGLKNASYDIFKDGHIDFYNLNADLTTYTLVQQYDLIDYRMLLSYDIRQANSDYYTAGSYESMQHGVYRIYPASDVMASDVYVFVNYSIESTFYPVITVSVNDTLYSHDMSTLSDADPLFTDENYNRFVIDLNNTSIWGDISPSGILNYIQIDYYLEDYGIETISIGDSASYNEGVISGYSNGFDAGYAEAKSIYENTQIQIDENQQENLLTFGNVMKVTFDGMANLLDQELFPGITLGLVIGLPILLTILMIILKIVRG